MMAEKLAPNFVDDEFRCKHCGKLPEKDEDSTYRASAAPEE